VSTEDEDVWARRRRLGEMLRRWASPGGPARSVERSADPAQADIPEPKDAGTSGGRARSDASEPTGADRPAGPTRSGAGETTLRRAMSPRAEGEGIDRMDGPATGRPVAGDRDNEPAARHVESAGAQRDASGGRRGLAGGCGSGSAGRGGGARGGVVGRGGGARGGVVGRGGGARGGVVGRGGGARGGVVGRGSGARDGVVGRGSGARYGVVGRGGGFCIRGWRRRLGRWMRALRKREDRGAATIFVLAVGLVLVASGIAGAAVGSARIGRHRAQAAADLGALAGAAQAIEGTEAACGRAARFVAANSGRVTSCEVHGLEIVIRTEVTITPLPGLTRRVEAAARAGPVYAWP
jgi:secretion/DNA translocation related TadE-like protein